MARQRPGPCALIKNYLDETTTALATVGVGLLEVVQRQSMSEVACTDD